MSHGRNAVLKLDDTSGALTDITSWCRSVTDPHESDSVEGTTMGSRAVERAAGLKKHGLEIEGISDATIDGYLDHAISREKSYEWSPAGTAAGKLKKSGEAICTAYSISINFEAEVTFSATFEGTGVRTRGAH